jgi:hypothetical protein
MIKKAVVDLALWLIRVGRIGYRCNIYDLMLQEVTSSSITKLIGKKLLLDASSVIWMQVFIMEQTKQVLDGS